LKGWVKKISKETKKVLNVRETAQYLGRSINNTLRMLHSGNLPAIRVDTRWMVSTNALDKWLIEEGTRQAKIRQEQSLHRNGGI
jgi:excisionase family DNA binding protein